jgi:hypothetical protein
MAEGCGIKSFASGWGSVAGCFKHGNKLPFSIKDAQLFD